MPGYMLQVFRSSARGWVSVGEVEERMSESLMTASSGGRAVYVEARDPARAREVLADAENVDEDEHARLSQEGLKRPPADS